MIAYIKGAIEDIGTDFVIIDFMGIGIRVLAPFSTITKLPSKGNLIKLHTYFQVKEDGFVLYGFKTQEELDIFEKLITVSGVGPKAALSILSSISIDNFINAVNTGDYKTLTLAPGIGKKSAERIILELKDKLPKVFINLKEQDFTNDALDALISLGYSRNEALFALSEVNCSNVEDAVKQALKKLMK
ncbi:MAG: Holliday junction branch migration protein RuvA [Thermoanaerobacteraceae bacterium]